MRLNGASGDDIHGCERLPAFRNVLTARQAICDLHIAHLAEEVPQANVGVSGCAEDARFKINKICGAEGTRTPDPHTASVVRYQLRHSPLLSATRADAQCYRTRDGRPAAS